MSDGGEMELIPDTFATYFVCLYVVFNLWSLTKAHKSHENLDGEGVIWDSRGCWAVSPARHCSF
jgi:hypothetical protein